MDQIFGHESEMTPLAAAAPAELAGPRSAAGLGECNRPDFGPALTAYECRLIAMALTGHTNNAIAGHLGISRRAVEFDFAHIYRKLGITQRAQLRFATLSINRTALR
jgi:DNA-binding CsgD family transcriptional regulator